MSAWANAVYLPAVSRAEHFAREAAILSHQLEEQLADVAAHWQPESFALPRLSALLLRRGKGEPAGIINEALALRERTKWVRKHLQQRVTALSADPFAPDTELRKAELGRYVLAVLGVEEEPRFVDALEVHFLVGLPAISLDIEKLYDWARYRMWTRRMFLFTELARVRHLESLDEELMIKLRTTATHRKQA